MIRECFKTKSGIMFESQGLRELGMDPASLWPEVQLRPPPLSAVGKTIISMPPTTRDHLAKIKELRFSHIPSLESFFNSNSSSDSDHDQEHDHEPSTGQTPLLKKGNRPRPKPRPTSRLAIGGKPPLNSELEIGNHHLTEEENELLDCLQPMYDQLSLRWFWWILEFWPMKQRYQRGEGEWSPAWGINMGESRFIPRQRTHGVKVHRSVKMRMEARFEDGSQYIPRAFLHEENITWVD
jgi:hypothetical protein